MEQAFREGVLVKPYERLSLEQIQAVDAASLRILAEPGIWCHNQRAARLFEKNGATIREEKQGLATVWRVSLPLGSGKGSGGPGPLPAWCWEPACRRTVWSWTPRCPGSISAPVRRPMCAWGPGWKNTPA